MILFQSSVFLYILGVLFHHNPPKKINKFWGFRTKKSMKNTEMWQKAQKEYGEQSQRLFMYSSLFSASLLILDIFSLIFDKEVLFLTSIILQSIILVLLLIILFYKVNNKLD